MPIDWFTVLAQATNFLVLIWLLKRFLYRPVLAAIDAREQAVAAALADATAAGAQAKSERDTYQQRSAQLEQQRAALLQQATEQAGVEGQRLRDQARQEAEAARAAQQAALRADASLNAAALALRAQQAVFAIARKVLADLAGADLEEGAVGAFLRQLAQLPAQQRDTLAAALRDTASPGWVRSAFALPQAQRDAIEAALRQLSGGAVALRYDTSPDLLAGIELTAGGQRLDWNIDAYLASWRDSLIATPVAADVATQPSSAAPAQAESSLAQQTQPTVSQTQHTQPVQAMVPQTQPTQSTVAQSQQTQPTQSTVVQTQQVLAAQATVPQTKQTQQTLPQTQPTAPRLPPGQAVPPRGATGDAHVS